MSILPKPVAANPVKSKSVLQISIFYAVILVIFAVAQLYSFDDFIAFITSSQMGLPLGLAGFIVPLLIFSEVFGLAFLLRLPLSVAFRWVSMSLSILSALIWVFLSSWIIFGHKDVATIGFLGTAVDLVPGIWAVSVSLALLILSIWAAWGLWPGTKNTTPSKNKS